MNCYRNSLERKSAHKKYITLISHNNQTRDKVLQAINLKENNNVLIISNLYDNDISF